MKDLNENSSLISQEEYQKLQLLESQRSGPSSALATEPPSIMTDYNQVVRGLKKTFDTGKTKDINFRIAQLKNLERMYQENSSDLVQALHKDLRKPELESYVYEIIMCIRDVRNAINKLSSWTKPKMLPRNFASLTDQAGFDFQPHGVVLIIGPWNYPMHLTLMPLAGAIAAGNCVLVKPSEVSTHCSSLMAALISKYLDQDAVKVLQGDCNETQKILQEKFDFIFFTGSSHVGKIIYSQAALTLTPVCLELGGKSPVYIDSSADIRMAAQRIIWAKCVCIGQTCVSPDYILCAKDVEKQFIEEAKKVLKSFYGENIQESKDLSRVINQRHFLRLKRLLNETRGTIAVGGGVDEYDLFIEPTILVDVDEHEPSMTEEIFGPILPIFTVKNARDAIDFINNRPNPLALYVFSTKSTVPQLFMEKTSSGGICINDALYHISLSDIPFGGVGESGLGQYHGKFSFKTFSRPRAFVHRSFSTFENKLTYALRYPPYTRTKFRLLSLGMMHFNRFYVRCNLLPYLFCFLLGLGCMFAFFLFFHDDGSMWNRLSQS